MTPCPTRFYKACAMTVAPFSTGRFQVAVGRLARVARTIPFRLAVAGVCLVIHLVLVAHSGQERFQADFNRWPGQPPAIRNPTADWGAQRWDRLVVARWDAGHYVALGLRGYQYCGPVGPHGELPNGPACDLTFYPTYGWLGRLLGMAAHIPIDVALFVISLCSSFVFLFLWTTDAMVERLGLLETYLSLVLFNCFTTGFSLVTVQTEPLTLALTLGSFIALRRRRYWLGALLAGAASGMRITGVAVSVAFGLALLVQTWEERPPTRAAWARRIGELVLAGWGGIALMAYHLYRFGDAFAYIHAHGAAFHHQPSILNLLWPKPEWLIHAIEQPLHEGVWLAVCLIWFLAGHRQALRRFSLVEQTFWYGLFVSILAITTVGLVSISFAGMNRYLLLALPLFFAMANLTRTRPALLAFWLVVSVWHYYQVDLCTYTGGPGNHVLQVCHAGHWVGRI